MTPDQIFSFVNFVALSSWVLLALLPRRRWVANVLAGMAVPALLAAAYVAIIATMWAGSSGGFTSLSAVATLFSNPWLLLAGWTHYLAFDLFVGSWEVRDARDRGIPHLLVLPCLALTFLFGPAGWLLYLAMRSQPWRRVSR
jgi:ABA4-like protein